MIGESVTFESFATDPDGWIANYEWDFGDNASASGPTLSTVIHNYSYGGSFWVYLSVTDNTGARADNEASMIRITAMFYKPPDDLETATNTTAPFAFLTSDKDITPNNTAVSFNMTSSYGVGGWSWCDEGDHSLGASWYSDLSYLTNLTMEFGDGSIGYVTPGTYMSPDMSIDHTYGTSGHYASKLTVKANNSNNAVQTIVMRTIHVLTSGAMPGSPVKNPSTFIKATIGEPQYLDPAFDYETAGQEVLQSVYENLIWYDGDSADVFKPVLATAIPTIANGGISADGLNYTFNLRTGVTFHDGTTMNADDVVYSIQRVLRIHDWSGTDWMLELVLTDYIGFSVGDSVSYYLDNSYNATWIRAVLQPLGWNHIITENDVKSVAEAVVLKVNDTAVRFRLTHPYSGFLAIMAYTVGNIVSKDFVEAHGGIVGGSHNAYMEQHTCGTGPYRLTRWEIGNFIEMTRFDGYWGTKPAIKDVYIVKANDVNTRILMLRAGDADSIYLPIKYESTFAGKPDYRISKGAPSFTLTFMTFNFNLNSAQANSLFGGNISDDFFHDVHMRRAFSHLLNFSLYIQNVARGNAEQPNGVIPKGMFGYNASIPKQEYSLTAAAAEFQLATNTNPANGLAWWQSGFTIPTFYNAGNLGRQTACEMIKQSLEALGGGPKTATVNTLDWPTYLGQMYNDNSYMPLYAIGWGPDYADPDDYTVPMLDSDYGTYPIFTGYRNDTINTLLRAAGSDMNPTTRAATYTEMSMNVYEDCPYIWLTQPCNFHVERSWISGYYYNPMFGGLYFPALSKSASDTPPRAYFAVTPSSGDVTTMFMFDAHGSSDLEEPNTTLEVRWDWEDDGIWDTSGTTTKDASHLFSAPGAYMVVLEVRDSGGLTNTTSIEVVVTEPIPEFGSILIPGLALAAVILMTRRIKLSKR
jgi:peptide/nickel transport system substrate-binding protein